MFIKDSFIRDIKDLIANVQPKPEGYLVDGKPCYKLEHLNEKGEWVE